MPTPIVCGMVIGSLPGRARRASAPTISPLMASRMRNVIMARTLPRAAAEARERGVARRRRALRRRRAPLLVRRRAHVQRERRTLAQAGVVDPGTVERAAVQARAGHVLDERRGA